jgi:acyl-ACP thioesterase
VTTDSALTGLTPDPATGRVFTASRTVRSTDATARGLLRLDAIARYLQDVAEDDLADAALAEPYAWVLRRVAITIRGYPAHLQRVRLRTFCSGTGPRWAERTTTLAVAGQDLIQARAVWAAVGRADSRPAPLTDDFHRCYGPSASQREVSTRLSLPAAPAGAPGRPWPLRVTDFDVIGHVNNSVHWAAVEAALAPLGWRPARAEMDYYRPVLAGPDPELVSEAGPGELRVWLRGTAGRLASARALAVDPPGLSR